MKKFLFAFAAVATLSAGCGPAASVVIESPPGSTTTPPSKGSGGVACTQEAKLCPDGSYVGRSGPNCEFVPCPSQQKAGSTTPTSALLISTLSPSSGPVGTTVTVIGKGFTPTGNTINFAIGSFRGYSSSDGKTLSFTVPTTLAPYCAPGTMCPQFILEVTPGVYNVNVVNANGTSNSLAFTVTCPPNAICSNPSAVNLSQLSPSSGAIGSDVTITGSGFTPTGNKIKFGNLGSENNPGYSLNSADGKTLIFTVPSSNYYACQASSPPCYPPNYVTPPGTYAVSVINANGTSNSLNFIVP